MTWVPRVESRFSPRLGSLRARIAEVGLPKREIAACVGVDTSAFSALLNGRRTLSADLEHAFGSCWRSRSVRGRRAGPQPRGNVSARPPSSGWSHRCGGAGGGGPGWSRVLMARVPDCHRLG